VILTAIAFAAALAGQDPDLPSVCDVEAETETPECSAALQARLLDMFGAAPIEAEAATAARIHRAFYADGYGRDVLLISFEMRRDQPPVVVIRGRDRREISHAIHAEVWDRVVDEGRIADLEIPAVPPPSSGEVLLCLHPWSAKVEMAHTENANGAVVPVRSMTESSCQRKTLAFRYAFQLAELAVEAIPACDQLDADQHRNDVARLEACLALAGNTVTAASLMNQKGDPPFAYGGHAVTPQQWADWLQSDTGGVLDWNGDVRSGRVRDAQNARVELTDIVLARTAPLSGLRIYQRVVGAHTADEGWIEGQLSWEEPDGAGGDRLMVADYRQEWGRSGDTWRLRRWIVGAPQPFRDPE
jgi:hypothetical protein